MQKDVEECVAEYVARCESGEALSIEAFAELHPHIRTKLLRTLSALEQAQGLLPKRWERPERIGPYRVVDALGAGGMGRVLRVHREEDPGTHYALKLMNEAAMLLPRGRKRFEREAQVLLHLDHPGIVRVHAVSAPDEKPYIVMELVDGTSVAELIDEAREAGRAATPALPGGGDEWTRSCSLVAELARTVAVLHARGILHRDLKPANVLLRGDGSAVLVDFGLAAVEEAGSLTQTGELIGTPHYMAPEQAFGQTTDERTDVYALGVLLYELLTLRRPHEGSDPLAVLEAIKSQPVVPIRRLRPDVPRPVALILENALAFRMRDRYANAECFAEDLTAFTSGRTIRARAQWSSRWRDLCRGFPRRVAAGTAVVLVAFVGAVIWAVWPSDDPLAALQQALDRATIAYASDDFATARAEAEKILAIDPTHPTGEFLQLAGDKLGNSENPLFKALVQGNIYRSNGDLHGAREQYEKALALAPSSPLPLVLLGRVATEIGEQTQQVGQLRAALDDQPDSSALHYLLGERLLLQSDYREAVGAFERAAALAEEPDVTVILSLAKAQFLAGELADSTDSLRAALGLPAALRWQTTEVLKWFVKQNGHGDAVREVLLEAVQERPDTARLLVFLALAFDWDELLPEARSWYERVLEVEPYNVSALECLVRLHSGASYEICEGCAEAFRRNPELIDPELTEKYALVLLEHGGSVSLGLAMSIVDAAIRVDRFDGIEAKLADLMRRAGSDEERESLQKALRKLRAYRGS